MSHPPRTSCQEGLLKIGKWPFKISQFLGFLPTTFKESNKTGFNNPSWPTISTIGFITFNFMAAVYWWNKLSMNSYSSNWLKSFDEKSKSKLNFVYIAGSLSMTWSGFMARFFMLKNREKFRHFWLNFVDTVQFLEDRLGREESFQKDWEKMSRKWRTRSITYILLTASVFAIFAQGTVQYEGLSGAEAIGLLIFCFSMTCQFMSPFVLTYFVQMYNLCLMHTLESATCETLQFIKSNKPNLFDNISVIDGQDWRPLKAPRFIFISVQSLLKCYHRLEGQIKEFNLLFGANMNLEVSAFGIQAIVSGYFIVTVVPIHFNVVSVLGNLVPILLPWYSVVHVCRVSGEITENSKLFAGRLIDMDFSQYKWEPEKLAKIQLSINHMSNHPLAIKSPFLDLHPKLISSVCGAVATYLVILVQFQG